MSSRLEKHDYFLRVADLIKERGTCPRRKVGCVIVDEYSHIIATGYNGSAKGMPHCIDTPCPGANLPSGVGLDKCEAIHAEQNALLQCPDVMKIHTVYSTTLPCVHCMKLLLNTSVKYIYYIQPYVNDVVFELAQRRGIELHQQELKAFEPACPTG